MEVKRGEIYLADLNPVIGSEQRGIRAVLILQLDKANKASPTTIMAPFTTKIKKRMLPCHAQIPKSKGGLKEDSILLCEQIRVIDKKRLIRRLGAIDEVYMEKVANAIKAILDIS